MSAGRNASTHDYQPLWSVVLNKMRANDGGRLDDPVTLSPVEAQAFVEHYLDTSRLSDRLRGGLLATVEGLRLAAECHDAIQMDSDEDEAIKSRAVGTMRLALVHAEDVLHDR